MITVNKHSRKALLLLICTVTLFCIQCEGQKRQESRSKSTSLDTDYTGGVLHNLQMLKIKKEFGLDTAILIVGTITKFRYDGTSTRLTYRNILEQGVKLKEEYENIIKDQESAFAKSIAIPNSKYKILKKYLGHKNTRISNGFFYIETSDHFAKDQLVEIAREIETDNNLRSAGDNGPENIYYFYFNQKFYAVVSSSVSSDRPVHIYVEQYVNRDQPLSTMKIVSNFDSVFSEVKKIGVKCPSDSSIEGVYFFAGYYNYLYFVKFRNEKNEMALFRVHPYAYKLLPTRYANNKFLSSEMDESLTNPRVYEENEFGDLYMYDSDPLGYIAVFKKIR